MLPRTLEPEVMDTRKDAWDYDSMDHREVNRRFVQDLLAAGLLEGYRGSIAESTHTEIVAGNQVACAFNREEEDRQPLLVLDLGTGTAQIPILLCQATDEVRVLAADAATSMLDLARLNVEIAGLRERIQLDHTDAKRMEYRDCMFDAVISNSIIHHIPEPLEVLVEAVRVAKPAGLLFFRDLIRPSDETQLADLLETYVANCNDHQRMLFRNSLEAALTVDEVRALVNELGFPAETVAATSDRHWTWIARRR